CAREYGNYVSAMDYW
nr:immunoglobulin heavy chain junction region [Mus musculus]NSM05176.1 immunoglobulin heavy chain junction region [Mus musculus]NSM07416.1 immunoglobulin heavy chain junction region [Mus musculus]NSM07971.1 immunoglobulin heavy chain junction region [Mus musculus]NSM08210.1 immunoglobulin heavy chain junction region [Mus musculus]